MKTKIMPVLAVVMASFGWQADAQTNAPAAPTNPPSEFRVVNDTVYDVNNSPEWKTITIPQSAAIKNLDKPSAGVKALKFDGTIQPQTIIFQIPGIYNYARPTLATIYNYPYSPNDFIAGNYQVDGTQIYDPITRKIVRTPKFIPGLLVPKAMQIRVFQKSQPSTNWDALGHAIIIPAKPVFDYGFPGTNIPARPFPSMLPNMKGSRVN